MAHRGDPAAVLRLHGAVLCPWRCPGPPPCTAPRPSFPGLPSPVLPLPTNCTAHVCPVVGVSWTKRHTPVAFLSGVALPGCVESGTRACGTALESSQARGVTTAAPSIWQAPSWRWPSPMSTRSTHRIPAPPPISRLTQSHALQSFPSPGNCLQLFTCLIETCLLSKFKEFQNLWKS